MNKLFKIQKTNNTKTEKIIMYTIVGAVFMYLAGYEFGKFIYYATH